MIVFDQYSINQLIAGVFSFQTMKSFFKQIKLAYQVAQQRHDLKHLDDHMLKDIGLTHAQVDEETNRDFWDIPNR